ncbi:hypothetical protein GGR75_003329 [Xanthomonas campestris]|nr:hypothetical protein [Xanthomonas campestris]
MGLFDQFSALSCATSETSFKAIPVSAHRKDFLGKGSDGAPIFLLHDASEAQYSPGVHFRHLTAQFHTTCRVHTDDTDLQRQFALAACDGAATDLHELFVRCFCAAIEELPINSGTRELNSCIQKLLDLFRALSQPSGRDVLGLWGELYVIASSGNIAGALAAWHEDPFDRFDFSWGTGVPGGEGLHAGGSASPLCARAVDESDEWDWLCCVVAVAAPIRRNGVD